MQKPYRIVNFDRTGRYLDFESAILVKIVAENELDYYFDCLIRPDCEEEIMRMENWLMFKDVPGKYAKIKSIAADHKYGKLWYLDLENDFIKRLTSVTNHNTGEGFIRPILQVIMVNPDIDIIDAKKNGISYKGRTAAQIRLDELKLPLEGEKGNQYYIIGKDQYGDYYGIPYDYQDENFHTMFKVDEIEINPYNGHITVKKRNVGVYNPILGQFHKFAQ